MTPATCAEVPNGRLHLIYRPSGSPTQECRVTASPSESLPASACLAPARRLTWRRFSALLDASLGREVCMDRYALILAVVAFASSTPGLAAGASPPRPGVAAPSSAFDLRGLYVVTNVLPVSKANSGALSAAFLVPGVRGAVLIFGWDGIE